MKRRSVGPIGGAIDRDDQRFQTVIVIGMTDDHPGYGVGKGLHLIARSKGDMVGDGVAVALRKSLQQVISLSLIQLPADHMGYATSHRNLFLTRQTSDDLSGKFAERVVACPEYGDRVAFDRFTNDGVADGGALG